jgi:hypothetical protein
MSRYGRAPIPSATCFFTLNTYRRQALLTRGEVLTALRSAISVANKGELRRKQEKALTNQAECLNLVTNAVIL